MAQTGLIHLSDHNTELDQWLMGNYCWQETKLGISFLERKPSQGLSAHPWVRGFLIVPWNEYLLADVPGLETQRGKAPLCTCCSSGVWALVKGRGQVKHVQGEHWSDSAGHSRGSVPRRCRKMLMLPPKVPVQQHCMKTLKPYGPILYRATGLILTFLQTSSPLTQLWWFQSWDLAQECLLTSN